MLSPNLIATVERDLTVARQLAYFHIGYSPDGQDMEVEPEQFVQGTTTIAAPQHSDAAAAASSPAAHIRVAISNPVQRPRQGTCAVLMELTRPLTWLSHRGRQRGPGSSGGGPGSGAGASGSAAAVNAAGISRSAPNSVAADGGSGAFVNSSGPASLTHASGLHPFVNGGAPGSATFTAASSSTSGAMATAPTGGGAAAATLRGSSSGNGVTHKANASATTSSITGLATGRGAHLSPPTSAALPPLLVATATLEVVFPVHYPHEPCQWHLSDEGSFNGLGDHATSSWAVTAHHRSSGGRPGVWSAGPSASSAHSTATSMEEGVQRRPVSSRLLAASAGENSMRSGDESGGAAGGQTALEASSPRLTAFVIPALGRQLLRWIAETRTTNGTSGRTSGGSGSGGGGSGKMGSGRGDVSPFLLDVACLLRCWSAMELDVHHLQLPSRIALAYGGGSGGGGGGGSQLLRAMASTHLSAATAGGGGGGGGSGGANANIGGGQLLPVSAGGAAAAVGGQGRAGDRFAPTGRAGSNSTIGASASVTTTTTSPNNANAAAAAAGGGMLMTGASSPPTGGNNINSGSGSSAVTAGIAAAAAAVSGGGAVVSGGSVVVTGSGGGGANAPTSSTGTGASALYPHRRRAAKTFIAVLLPLGDVAVCGGGPPASMGPVPRRTATGGAANAAASVVTGGGAAAPPAAPATTATGCAAEAKLSDKQLARLPHCLVPLYEHMRRWADADAAAAAGCKAVAPSSSPQSPSRASAPRGTIISVTTQFTRGKVLPTLLLPAHVLGSVYRCDWDDVRLFAGQSAEAALHTNAKLAKALRLPDVSDLLQVLRRLAKNVGRTTTGVVYLGEVLWPTLMQAVQVLRSSRQPLWAGVAVCALLLPSVLEEDAQRGPVAVGGGSSGSAGRSVMPTAGLGPRGDDGNAAAAAGVGGGFDASGRGGHPSRRWQHTFAELIDVVAYTERVLAIAQEYTLLCEARLVRCALQRGQEQLTHTTNTLARLSQAAATRLYEPPVLPLELCRRLHAPISVCAVCGLSLLRNTVKQHDGASPTAQAAAASSAEAKGRRDAHKDPASGTHTAVDHDTYSAAAVAARVAAARRSVQTRGAEGCLVVQCARCGHGGHVEHMSSWWNDPTVHCCPKGCDCICEY